MSVASADENVLEVKGLQTVFFTNSGLFRAVDDVSFHVKRGETLAIVGESGCGKSVSALSIMRLVPNPPGRIVGGEILLEGTDLLTLDEAEMRQIRGNRISMIFQEPMTSLNPVIRIGDQISEAVRLHRAMTAKEALESGRGDAAAGAHSRAGAARAGISASTLRRHAPARDDRDGDGVPAGAPDRGRADHRARRHHPGANPRADARPAERARHGTGPDHPRPRRRRADRAARDRDVCRQEGRGGRRRHIVRRSAPSLYARLDGLDPGRAGAAGESGSAAHRNSRHGAVA